VRINEGLQFADEQGATEEDIVPLLLVVAEVAAANGNREKAQNILDKVNGHTPRAVEDEFAKSGTISITAITEALLPEFPEAA
jgi:adenosylcobinamide amidohydrolase